MKAPAMRICAGCGGRRIAPGPPEHCRECGCLDFKAATPAGTDEAFAQYWRQADPAAAFREFVRKNDRSQG